MPTRHGWAMLVAAAGSITVGRLFGLMELYVIGAALATAMIVALVVVNRPLPQVSVRRVARPATVAVGEPARVDLQVTNKSQVRTPRLKLWEPVGDKGGAPMQLAPLAAGDAVSAAYRVPTTRRGVLRTGPLRAERTDPLGLCTRVVWLAGASEVLVVPERVPLAFPSAGSAGRLGQHLRIKAFGQTGSEFHSQREYTPGDDLRRINWKSSARVGTLIVRETAQEGVQRCVVALDTNGDGYDDDSFERAVVAAASVVSAACEVGIATRLVAPGLDLRGHDVAQQSLRWLATVSRDADLVDHTTPGRSISEGLGLLVVITSHTESRAAVAARTSAGPDESVVTVCATVPSASTKGFHVDATSLLHLQMSWNHLVHGRGAG